MNLITIAREFGAGGGEAARKLADSLGWELLDRELLHQAAQIEHVPDADLERFDEQALTMADRFRLHPPHQKYIQGLKLAVEKAAQRGNVVLVGRGARHLVGERAGAMHLRLVAPMAWRAQRMARLQGGSADQAMARCTAVDRIRNRFARYFFGKYAELPVEYDMVFNTGRYALDDVVATIVAIVRGNSTAGMTSSARRRVLTLSRELGAGEQGFAPTLGQRLGMRVFDRELLQQEAARLGVSEARLQQVEEHPAGALERLHAGGISKRHFEALGQIMRELAQTGDVILVGRGGSRVLGDDPQAVHVHLVAAMPTRIRRVMEYHWVQEAVAKRRIAESDSRRSSFYRAHFGADWSSPLEYDLTVNSARLGPLAVEAVALAAERRWIRTG